MNHSKPTLDALPPRSNPSFWTFDEPLLIAEIGGNHEGSFDYAKKLLHDVAGTGAQVAKFQTYSAGKIVSSKESPARHAHFKKFELSLEQFEELANLAKADGLTFMTSVWDIESLEALAPHLPMLKIGSGDLTNYPMLEAVAKLDKPVILSTAMSTLEDVRGAVKFLDQVNPRLIPDRELAVLHCVAMYGAPRDEYANLRSIFALQDAFPNIPVGYSDHTIGTYACELALAMGSSVLEFHFTDDPAREFRDHALSKTKEETTHLAAKARQIRSMLGVYGKQPVSAVETAERIKEFRRGVYAARDLKAGTVLTRDDLSTLRPAAGLDARMYFDCIGRKVVVGRETGEPIRGTDLDPPIKF